MSKYNTPLLDELKHIRLVLNKIEEQLRKTNELHESHMRSMQAMHRLEIDD